MSKALQGLATLVAGTAAYLLLVRVVCQHSGYANCLHELLGFSIFRKDFIVASLTYFVALAVLASTIHSLFARPAALLRRLLAGLAIGLVLFAGFAVLVVLEVGIDKLGP